MFLLTLVPLILVVGSSLDLHKRRKCRLGPKRIIIAASIALLLLVVSLAVLGSCYFQVSNDNPRCPVTLQLGGQIWYYNPNKMNLSSLVPFLMSFGLVL